MKPGTRGHSGFMAHGTSFSGIRMVFAPFLSVATDQPPFPPPTILVSLKDDGMEIWDMVMQNVTAIRAQ